MGCDIHLKAEVYDGERWRPAKMPMVVNPYAKYEGEPAKREESIYRDRNYDTFAILANVRNGYGFAGCDTGDEFNFISEPRGLPNDLSMEFKGMADDWIFGDHSFSWLLLSEILAFDWTQKIKQRGVVNARQYKSWTEYGKRYGEGPESYCGGVSGSSTKTITNEEMDAALVEGDEDFLKGLYTQVEWEEDYAQAAKGFWWKAIPRLLRLGPPEKVRIVFGFDS
jgi:hypothetical protein